MPLVLVCMNINNIAVAIKMIILYPPPPMPMNVPGTLTLVINVHNFYFCCRALLNHKDKLPEDRQKLLLETVAEHFDCDVSEVNHAHLESASQIDPK